MTTIVYKWAPRAHNMGVALGQSVPRNRSQTSNCNSIHTGSSSRVLVPEPVSGKLRGASLGRQVEVR
jgi:hypothetical protein